MSDAIYTWQDHDGWVCAVRHAGELMYVKDQHGSRSLAHADARQYLAWRRQYERDLNKQSPGMTRLILAVRGGA